MSRILGIDYGTRYLGFALGDVATGVAVPLDVVEISNQDPVKIVWAMVEEDGYDKVVVGEPKSIDGEETEGSAAVAKFVASLSQVVNVPVELVSEHMTSKVSDMLAAEAGSTKHDDALAAMLIVQEYLNDSNSE